MPTIKEAPKKASVQVMLDEDVRLKLRMHRATSGESVSSLIERLVRAAFGMPGASHLSNQA